MVDVLIRKKSVWQIDAKKLDGINSLNVRKKRWKKFIWKARATEDNFFSFWCVNWCVRWHHWYPISPIAATSRLYVCDRNIQTTMPSERSENSEVMSVLFRPYTKYFKVVQGYVPSAPADARAVSDSWLSCIFWLREYVSKVTVTTSRLSAHACLIFSRPY